MQFMPLAGEMRQPCMLDRHWDQIRELTKSNFNEKDAITCTLKTIWDLELTKYGEAVEEVTDQSKQEDKMQNNLTKFNKYWKEIKFKMDDNANNPDIKILKILDDDFEVLEEHQVLAQNMNNSR